MKNFSLWIVLFALCMSNLMANTYKKDAKFHLQQSGVFLVDDFEDGDLGRMPEWWTFGNVALVTEINDQKEMPGLDVKSLRFVGQSHDWYIGGVGTYLAVDMAPYNAIKLIVRGSGPQSGTLMIELYDDDNKNWEIEPHSQDPSRTYADDKFIYTLKVDWLGWQVVILPLDQFVDANKGVGDDIWNPYQRDGSGGLLQMQLVVLGHDKVGHADFRIDSIKFFKQSKVYAKKREKSIEYLEDSF